MILGGCLAKDTMAATSSAKCALKIWATRPTRREHGTGPAGIRRSTCSAAEAVYLEPRDDQLAPDPARCFDCPVDPAPAAQ